MRLARGIATRLGYRVIRESSLPRGLDPLIDLFDTSGFPRLGVAVDVGANVGQSVEYLLERGLFSKVIACEPAPVAFEELKRRYGKNPTVALECAAIGARPGVGKLRILGPTSELNHLVSSEEVGAPSIEVRVDTIDQLASRHSIDSIALLKVDTEGNELSVLEGAWPLLASGRVEAVLAECGTLPEDRKHTTFEDLWNDLRRFDLVLMGLYDVHHQGRGIHYCNALFARK